MRATLTAEYLYLLFDDSDHIPLNGEQLRRARLTFRTCVQYRGKGLAASLVGER